MPYLRQSTAQTIRFGPFLDKTDGVTEETALTITPALRRLSKDGGAFAAASGAVNATHDSDGWYSAILTTTDTNTVGELILNVQVPATHLPVWMRWWVLEEEVYDDMFGATAVGYLKPVTAGRDLDVTVGGAAGIDWGNIENKTTINDLTQTVIQLCDTVTANTDMRGTDSAALAADLLDKLGAVNEAAAAGDPSATESVMQYVKQIVNILVGTAGVVTFPAEAAPANAVSLAEVIRAIHVDVTGIAGSVMRGTDGVDTAAMRGTDGVDIATMRGTDGVDTAAMRGTDNAALASVLGALADAAAAGDPTAADTLMQYIKQLINILIGTAGIVTFPAEAAPANAVSLAEVIRAIHADVTGIAGAAMRGTDGVDPAAMRGTDDAALASVATETRLAELDAANLPTDIEHIHLVVDQVLIDTDSLEQTKIPDVISLAAINAEVKDVIDTDATGEPGQEALPVSTSLRGKIDRMYKAYRNKKTQNSTDWKLFNDAGTVVDSKATVSDAAGLATKEEIITGP